jgi:hypothetical protein
MAAQRPSIRLHAEHANDLAFLALRAAIQLNRSLKGKETDQTHIRAFINAIDQTPGLGSALDRSHIAANAKAVSLLSGALLAARKEPMSTREVLKRIAAFVEGVDSHDPKLRQKFRQEMRDFCLALHSRILAQKHPAKDTDTVFGGGLREVGLH